MNNLAKTEKKSRLLNFFPVPDFLKMKSAGIDINDHGVYFVDFFTKRGNLRPRVIIERKLPEGIVVDGDIKKREDLLLVLRSVRAEAGIGFVKASFPDEKTYFYEMSVPGDLDKAETRNYLEFHLDENVPINPKDTVFDFVRKGDIKSKSNIFSVCAANVKDAESYAGILRDAGFFPTGLCPSSQAAATAVHDRAEKVSILLIFGRRRTRISIVEDGIVSFTSIVPIGGEDVIEAIRGSFNVSYEEARKISEDKAMMRDKASKERFFSTMAVISPFQEEVQKIVSYWESRGRKSAEIKRIILLGKRSASAGFEEYISYITGKPVSVGDVWRRVFDLNKYIPSLGFRDSLEYGTAIGLAL